MTPKRVLYVWQAPYPWDIRVEKICAGLARAGYEVQILARRGNEAEAVAAISGFTVHRVGPGPGARPLRPLSLPMPGNPLWAAAIKKRIQEFRPHVVIARDIPLALPTATACRRAGVPWIIDMAEHYPVAMRTWKKYQENPVTRFAINTLRMPDRIERRAVKLADGVVPVIEEQRDRLIREYGCDPSTIVPVLNTPELEKVPPKLEPRKPSGRFGYIGVVIQDRDLLTVLRGFDLAAGRNAQATLLIAGGGESEGDLKRELERCKHRDRIRMTGRYRPEQQAELLDAVDYGIVPWAVNDFSNNTIANKFFDYAAYGKPVAYAETDPMVRLMKTMRFGRGYRGGDAEACSRAMLELLDADYAELGRNGRSAVEKQFNWGVDLGRMTAFLEELAAKGPRAQ